MTEEEILQSMEKTLETEGIDCSFESPSDEIPYPRLMVYLGTDHKDRDQVLEIISQVQEMGEVLKEIPVQPNYVRVQFQSCFPFTVKDHALHDTTGALMFINRLLDLPGFELSEIDDKLFYRYVLLTTKDEVDKQLLLGIVGNVMLLLDMYTEMIEQLAEGKMTFNEILEKVIECAEAF